MTDTEETTSGTVLTDSHNAHPAVTTKIDIDKYRHHIVNLDMREEQETALILTLRDLMLAFVDLGFEFNPVQHVPEGQIACGQNAKSPGLQPISLIDMIQSIILDDIDLPSAFAAAGKSEKVR